MLFNPGFICFLAALAALALDFHGVSVADWLTPSRANFLGMGAECGERKMID